VKVLDPGHQYSLRHLDGDGEETLQFVKREGKGYPGNIGHHEGTTMQEVLRVLIHRAKYVNKQIPCRETELAIKHMRTAIYQFEVRAAFRHGRRFRMPDGLIEEEPTCVKCGHIGCEGACRPSPAVERPAQEKHDK
jgi:hypothetical protein